jgi:hypothetical protein
MLGVDGDRRVGGAQVGRTCRALHAMLVEVTDDSPGRPEARVRADLLER